jgi:hypothetical protein
MGHLHLHPMPGITTGMSIPSQNDAACRPSSYEVPVGPIDCQDQSVQASDNKVAAAISSVFRPDNARGSCELLCKVCNPIMTTTLSPIVLPAVEPCRWFP